MADKENNKDEMVQVPMKLLEKMQKDIAEAERKAEESIAKVAGVEAAYQSDSDSIGAPKLKEKKNYEPKFRTVRLRQYPIAGNQENLGYVVGWTNRGAYQEIDKTGISPIAVDFIDVVFHGHDKTSEGKIKAEKIRLLDLLNKSVQVHCKIVDMKKDAKVVPTGEEINVTTWDPVHGLIDTGEKIDGFVTYSDINYKLQIPGIAEPVWIDAEFVN